MPGPSDFLPSSPWEGPPLPKFLGNRESKQDKILKALRAEVLEEIKWKSTKSAEGLWGQEGESSWAREEWGEVKNGMITLFHGTDSGNIPDILRRGLSAKAFSETWDVGEGEEAEEIAESEYGVSLAVTPYYAFFYGDTCVRVRIPFEWISSFNIGDDEVIVNRDIPPGMIVEVKSIEEWRANR